MSSIGRAVSRLINRIKSWSGVRRPTRDDAAMRSLSKHIQKLAAQFCGPVRVSRLADHINLANCIDHLTQAVQRSSAIYCPNALRDLLESGYLMEAVAGIPADAVLPDGRSGESIRISYLNAIRDGQRHGLLFWKLAIDLLLGQGGDVRYSCRAAFDSHRGPFVSYIASMMSRPEIRNSEVHVLANVISGLLTCSFVPSVVPEAKRVAVLDLLEERGYGPEGKQNIYDALFADEQGNEHLIRALRKEGLVPERARVDAMLPRRLFQPRSREGMAGTGFEQHLTSLIGSHESGDRAAVTYTASDVERLLDSFSRRPLAIGTEDSVDAIGIVSWNGPTYVI